MSGTGCGMCDREVCLVGGLCGRCSTAITRNVRVAFARMGCDADIVDVYEHEDGHYHLRFDFDDLAEGSDGGEL